MVLLVSPPSVLSKTLLSAAPVALAASLVVGPGPSLPGLRPSSAHPAQPPGHPPWPLGSHALLPPPCSLDLLEGWRPPLSSAPPGTPAAPRRVRVAGGSGIKLSSPSCDALTDGICVSCMLGMAVGRMVAPPKDMFTSNPYLEERSLQI